MFLFLDMEKLRHTEILKNQTNKQQNVDESPDFLIFIPLVIQCTKSEQPDRILIWHLNVNTHAEALKFTGLINKFE